MMNPKRLLMLKKKHLMTMQTLMIMSNDYGNVIGRRIIHARIKQ